MPNNTDFTTHKREAVTEIFGPGSDSRKAAELARRDPALYNSLKQSACYEFGLLPEAMLPLRSRVKKEDIEARHRANLAAAKDDLIPLSQELSDRLGLPIGSRVTFAQLQATLGRRVE